MVAALPWQRTAKHVSIKRSTLYCTSSSTHWQPTPGLTREEVKLLQDLAEANVAPLVHESSPESGIGAKWKENAEETVGWVFCSSWEGRALIPLSLERVAEGVHWSDGTQHGL